MVKGGAIYLGTLVVFLGLDAVWLSLMGKALYKPTLGDMLRPAFAPAPAVVFYLVYIAGLCYFAVRPAARDGLWTEALVSGAFFGFVAYATYDLTNMATLRNWTLTLTLADLAWGTIVSAAAATAGYAIASSALWRQ